MSTKDNLENMAKNTWLAGLGSINSSKDALGKSIEAAQEKSNNLYNELLTRGEEIQRKIDGKRDEIQAKGKKLLGIGVDESQTAKLAELNAAVDDLTSVVVKLIEKRNAEAKKVTPKVAKKVAAKPATKTASKTAPKVAAKAVPKKAPKVVAKAIPKKAAKAVPKAATESAPKAATKPSPKASTTPAPKTAVKAVTKTAPKVAAKAENTKNDASSASAVAPKADKS